MTSQLTCPRHRGGGYVGGWVLCACGWVLGLAYGALGRPLRWLTLLGGRANCSELPPECQGARQVLSTNFLLVAVPVAPDKGLGNVRQLSAVSGNGMGGVTWGLRPTRETGKLREP